MPKKTPETPLYVRLPSTASQKLDRAAEALGVAKKDLVAGLVAQYVDPDDDASLSALGALSMRNARGSTMQIGSYSFQRYDPPEVMSAAQAGLFLQIDERDVIELAEAGQLPGRKLGPVWRFSREALVAWLSAPANQSKR